MKTYLLFTLLGTVATASMILGTAVVVTRLILQVAPYIAIAVGTTLLVRWGIKRIRVNRAGRRAGAR